MNNLEGQIIINLCSRKNTNTVEIRSTRPLAASKLLIGKTPEQALSLIPLLFNICCIAQSRAALLAIEQKLRRQPNNALETAREILLLAENAREHLLRILLDWPGLFQLNPPLHNLAYPGQLTQTFSTALFIQGQAFSLNSRLNDDLEKIIQQIDQLDQFLVENIFHTPIEYWQNFNQKNLLEWAGKNDSPAAASVNTIFNKNWETQGHTECAILPTLDDGNLLKLFDSEYSDQFIAQPQWQGQCFETTALSRQFTHPLIQDLHHEYSSGLMTRWVARLVELAAIPNKMRSCLERLTNRKNTAPDASTPTTIGIAQVEAARGRLIHQVDIKDHLISQYQILAPTEWNFHPRGVLSKNLSALKAQSNQELDQLSHLIINAIDPCVAYQSRVN